MAINFNKNQISQIYYGSDGQLKVDSSNASGVSCTTINSTDLKQSQTQIAVVDEQIKLYDGKYLKRIRDNLIIE